jgi:hypothetical protein
MPTLAEALRVRKEAYVSGLSGTDSGPVIAVLALLPALLLLHRAASAVAAELLPAQWRASSRGAPGALSFAAQCAYYVAPVVVALTVPLRLHAAAGGAACALALAAGLHGGSMCAGGPPLLVARGAGALPAHALHALDGARPAFVTHFRGALALLTGLAVLGVDLAPFPRALAKTEAWGVSLMDAGSGAAAFSVGLSAAVAAGGGGGVLPSLPAQLAPLLALGVARPLAHAALRLPQRVGEYGAHWNFFLTLAVVVTVAHCALRARAPACGALAAAAAAALAGEAALLARAAPAALAAAPQLAGCAASYYARSSWAHWALCAERGADACAGAAGGAAGRAVCAAAALNREGLLSLPGYAALCLLGVGVGRLVAAAGARAAAAAAAGEPAYSHWHRLLAQLLALAGALAGMWESARRGAGGGRGGAPGFPAARRLANAPYALWCGALCTGWLAAWLAVEALTRGGAPATEADALAARLARAREAAAALQADAGAGAGATPPPPPPPAQRLPPQALPPAALLAALSDRALLAFVAANLLTGAANAACDAAWGAAQDAPEGAARAVLMAHGVAFAGAAWAGKWTGRRHAQGEKEKAA